MGKKIDLLGKRFGKWLVLKEGKRIKKEKSTVLFWTCQCECGTIRDVQAADLNFGKSTNCGCQRIEAFTSACYTHGMTHTLEYEIWLSMKDRCFNSKNKAYHNYGGRGIIVCERWRNSFELFYADMGKKPKGLSVERRDNNGNYEPDNCHWGTRAEQSRNKRNNVWIEYNGERKILQDWANGFGVSSSTLYRHLKRMSISDASQLYALKKYS